MSASHILKTINIVWGARKRLITTAGKQIAIATVMINGKVIGYITVTSADYTLPKMVLENHNSR